MSAFLVEDKTINRIITYLATGQNMKYLKRAVEEKYNIDLNTNEGKTELGNIMFKMNVNAVNGGAEDFRPLDYTFRVEPVYNKYQALKSLSCWTYQCREEPIVDTKDYKFFEEIKLRMAYNFVICSHDYDKAAGWD